MEFYSAIKKKEILLFPATWMNLENIKLSEICWKDKYYVIICMWTLKIKLVNVTKKKLTGTSLVVQLLGFCIPNAVGQGLTPLMKLDPTCHN